jgi:predicted NBD/HSP70 family sugar kinase
MFLDRMSSDEKNIFLKLQKDGPLTKKALLELTGIKPSTLNRIIISLMEQGAVVEIGQEQSAVGRKPSIFDVNVGEKYLLGIDISRTYLIAVLCDMKLRMLASIKLPLGIPFGDQRPVVLLPLFCAQIRQMLKDNQCRPSDLLGVGGAMVGPVARSTGKTQDVNTFLTPGWNDLALGDIFSREFGCSAYVANGAYAAVLVEYLYGAGRNHKSISFFNCGIGIRSGHIASGVIIRSADNEEASFAHTTIAPMGERCSCGKRGCIGCYSSTLVISENVRRRILSGRVRLLRRRRTGSFIPMLSARPNTATPCASRSCSSPANISVSRWPTISRF